MRRTLLLFSLRVCPSHSASAARPVTVSLKKRHVDYFQTSPMYREYLGDVPIHNFMNAQVG